MGDIGARRCVDEVLECILAGTEIAVKMAIPIAGACVYLGLRLSYSVGRLCDDLVAGHTSPVP